MLVLRQVRQANDPRHGRHAIRRERSFAEVSRLRHAQLTLSRGVHRTRVSEMRSYRVHPVVAGCHPYPFPERIPAASAPVLTG